MAKAYTWYRGSGKSGIKLSKKREMDLGPELAPKAPAPPWLTASPDDGVAWADTCKGGYPRCGVCALCMWEDTANRWLAVAPWFAPLKLLKPETAPRWPNVHAAIRALAEHELYGRTPASPIGQILDNLRQGAVRLRKAGTTYRRDREDPVMARASEVAWVDRAIYLAYQGNRWGLPVAECRALLIVCTDGVLPSMPKLEDLGKQIRLPAGMCRDVVRYGRRAVTIELAARRLLPMPNKQLGLHDRIDLLREKKGWQR